MDELTYLRNAWNTCIEMVTDRGYSIQNEYRELSESDFKYLIQENKLDIYGTKQTSSVRDESDTTGQMTNDDDTGCIFVKFILARRIKPTAIKACIDEIRNLYPQAKSMEVVLVLKIEPNHSIYKIEKEKSERDNSVQIMHCKQLQMNVTKHFLVPKHTRISEEEATELMRTYNLVSRQQLPLLLKDDPVARYYNYKSGDIISITNNSISMNYGYCYYRCVR
jgi:DNA-directed RNA polymerase I, II, and III subunit RPABC1